MNDAAARTAAAAARVGQAMRRADPLLYRRMSSPQARQLIEWVVQGVDAYGHAGNAAAKTDELCAFFLRLCRHQKGFDARLMGREGDPEAPAETEPYWIDLPGPPASGEAWRHWVLVQSYDQAKDSSMRTYRKLLGKHPHKIGWLDRANGKIKLIKVKPDGWHSDDPETWSEITFISQENMTDEDVRYVQGARVNSIQMDEIGKMSVWRECRARRIANETLYLAIGATPEYKHEWEEFLEDYRSCLFRPVRGRVRVQWSVRDNRALSLEDIESRIQGYLKGTGEKSDLYEARVAGEHVDSAGACPFPSAPMLAMLRGCLPGRLDVIEIRGEPLAATDPDYRDFLPADAVLERWRVSVPGHSYLITADTSRGIDDEKHDPCEMEVWDWSVFPHECVARFGMRKAKGGYLDEDSLAILADRVGREYNKALVDVEVTGNFGVQFVLTMRKLRYPNLAHDDKSLEPGTMSPRYGWTANPTTNGENVNALIKGLNEGTFVTWSADMVQQWMDVREDEQGRPANVRKGARHHREAMVCAGRALHHMQTKPAPVVMQRRAELGLEAALRKDFGRPVKIPGRPSKRGRPELFRADLS